MKLRIAFLLLVACRLPAWAAEKPKPFQVLELHPSKLDASECKSRWSAHFQGMIWMDEDHLVALENHSCPNRVARERKHKVELMVFDQDGHSHSALTDFDSGLFAASSGVLLLRKDKEVAQLNNQLITERTLNCPLDGLGCGIFVAPPESTGSEFALCSRAKQGEDCAFYSGMPSEKVAEKQFDRSPGIRFDPYVSESLPAGWRGRLIWRVGPTEYWGFSFSRGFVRMDASGVIGPVLKKRWPSESNLFCTADLSAAAPRRFLATCNGAHFYTDGELDSLFGYSRIALFDVTSRMILARIDGRAGALAALSPSGEVIAVRHGNKILLYRVN